MQIFALDENDRQLSALQAEKNKVYACPSCRASLKVKGGFLKRRHFYHLRTPLSCRLKKKSALHLAVQLKLSDTLPPSECALEVPFPKFNRIADCVWEKQKIIFEIQCSPISYDEIKKRSNDYAQAGYYIVWIFHEKTFRKKSEAEIFAKNAPHYYTNINVNGLGHFYDWRQNLKQKTTLIKPLFTKIKGERKHWSLHFDGDLTHHVFVKEKTKRFFYYFLEFVKRI